MKKSLVLDVSQALNQEYPNYPYYYDGARHTDTSTDYLTSLGLNEEEIKSLQDSAKWNQEQQAKMSE